MAGLPKDPKEMTETDWKQVLNPKEYNVLRQKGTEPAGTGEYDGFYRTFWVPK
jgi:peptide-methionine (R)-S-oxide reductase